ncbi:uncharacterized protein B0H18DRAFT_1117771 [Fomitopsis serialis]|uniref:uncharacterized protein n=1 Tax=Fomitopsis serialis TaxID=139415 RepID=UPI0020087C53|nr:uncharacterized protein B0H18DRAFT_1117771 [Neoantrodia serialis]KAH9928961.1 hypothetical protein B0H18DRAFT_1117771 [Neoantrodia serialis]
MLNNTNHGRRTVDGYTTTRVNDPLEPYRPLAKVCRTFMYVNLKCIDEVLEHRCRLPPLLDFVAYALYRSRPLDCVVFATLMLMHRIEVRRAGHQPAQLFAPQHLFLAVMDGGGPGIPLKDLTKAIRDVCVDLLDWNLQVNPDLLARFATHVRKDYIGGGPYPIYDSGFALGLTLRKPYDEDQVAPASMQSAREGSTGKAYFGNAIAFRGHDESMPSATHPGQAMSFPGALQQHQYSVKCGVAMPCAW